MISLIFCGDLKYCPYIERYIERLEKNNIKYEVVFWNRSGDKLTLPKNYKYYDTESKLAKNKISKLKDFIMFRRWLINYVGKTKCKKFVLLSTLTGVLIGNELKKREYKYIFDIRDYSYEWLWLYYMIEDSIIKNSYKTVISSPGFINFLPKKYDYVIAHNFNRIDLSNEKNKNGKNDENNGVVKIVWNGVVRFFDYQSKLIKALANDRRFELIYHGDGPDLKRLKNYCKKEKINNVIFTGKYDNANKSKLLFGATILNNCYGYLNGNSSKLKYAISNKFYDGIIYCIPQMVEKYGYKADLVVKHNLGIALDVDSDVARQILSYLNSLDYKKMKLRCNKLLAELIKEDNRYVMLIDDFIKMENRKEKGYED